MTAHQDRVLDWVPRFDDQSREYPVRRAAAPHLHNRTWRVPAPLDQGREGACVGFGWTHEALSTPVAVELHGDPNAYARQVYNQAKRIDEWAGEDYDGTSVLAGAKVMKAAGYLREYRWAFNIQDVVASILATGPVVLGVNWYDTMYEAPDGLVTVGGDLAGGHCILATGYRLAGRIYPDEPAISLFNSWGPSWGVRGLGWIRQSQLARLLDEGGEACVPYRRAYGPRPVTIGVD